MSASLPAPLLSFVPSAQAAPPVIPSAEQYRVGEWTYCDVHLLARAWGETEDQARQTISYKIGVGATDIVRQTRDAARQGITPTGRAVRPYFEAGYDYNDADALSRAWSMSIDEVKAYIENKIVWKMEDGLSGSLLEARVTSPADPSLALSIPAPYNLCDVQMLAAYKQTPSTEAIRRMTTAPAGTTKKLVGEARKAKGGDEGMCSFWTLGYTYEDAEKLAGVWGVDVYEAKARVGTAARKGQLATVNAALGR